MPASLKDQRVVVIGGTSGIGFAVAERARDDGARVIVGSSRAENVEAALARLGNEASGAAVDVRDETSVRDFFADVGELDHLVYTAGDWGPNRGGGSVADIDLAHAFAPFEVRFKGALTAIKYAQQGLTSDGSITLTDGLVAHRPRKGAPLSTAMAGAIEHLTRGLAIDLAPVRVNAVCPGMVLTEIWDSIPEDQRAERIQQLTARQPIPRAGDPGEVAEAYLYLMRGGFSTGQVLIVDGGKSLI